jgi:putative antitoxin of VapBC-like toxin-antitoxin system
MTEVHMRTTVILKDDLVKKAKRLSGKTTLSALFNDCLAAWIAQHRTKDLKSRLLSEYKAVRQESRRISRQFEEVNKEAWPSW